MREWGCRQKAVACEEETIIRRAIHFIHHLKKLDILQRCLIKGENVHLVSEEVGYNRTSIYTCRRKYQSEGPTRLMNSKDDPRGILKEDTCSSTKETEKDQYALPMPLRKL